MVGSASIRGPSIGGVGRWWQISSPVASAPAAGPGEEPYIAVRFAGAELRFSPKVTDISVCVATLTVVGMEAEVVVAPAIPGNKIARERELHQTAVVRGSHHACRSAQLTGREMILHENRTIVVIRDDNNFIVQLSPPWTSAGPVLRGARSGRVGATGSCFGAAIWACGWVFRIQHGFNACDSVADCFVPDLEVHDLKMNRA